MGRSAATDDEVEGQQDLFPELDAGNPEHKTLMRLARAYAKKREERKELFTTAKDAEDTAMERLVEAMHGQKLSCFRFEGVRVELETKEKAKVKLDVQDDDEEDGDDD
jgi:hypothetical protein